MTTIRVCLLLDAECPHPSLCHLVCMKQWKASKPTQPLRMPAYGTPDLGWQCPVCKKVNAPFTPSCDCHAHPTSTGTQATRP